MPCLLVLVPLLFLIIINLSFKGGLKKTVFWLGVAFCLIQILLVIYPSPKFWDTGLGTIGNILRFDLDADNLSFVLLLSIGIVVFITFLVSNYMITEETQKFLFMNLLLVILIGMNGIVLVKDIFTLYVFLEITALSSFILISFNKNRDALEGAFKYVILSCVATILMLTSIALIIFVSGDASFLAIHSALTNSKESLFITIAIGLFLSGVFIKAGLVPFHGWLADAYSSAPSSVSVLLAGIVTKTLGVYTLMRIVISVFGFTGPIKNIIMLVGAVSIVFAALAALAQNDFKRMLAYSSISQVGYILLSFGCGTALGITGAVFHLFNHAIFKSLLFVNSAALRLQTGARNMDKMGGLASKMPITGTTSILASLSAAGMPPLAGFWSKLIIVVALWTTGHYVYAMIAVLASILTLGYMLMMQRRVFFGKLAAGLEGVKEVGMGLILPMVILAAIVVGAGLFFPWMLNTFMLPVENILE